MNSKKGTIFYFGRTPMNLFRVGVLIQARSPLVKNASRQIDSEVLIKKRKKESLATYALLQLNAST